jgi:Ca2+-binding RTX toxin-like protein
VGHGFSLDDSAGLGGLMLAAAMTANLTALAGKGSDVLIGGAGNNTFAFNSLSIGADQITDFNNTNARLPDPGIGRRF